MNKSEFHREFCSKGRNYLLSGDLYLKYTEIEKIKKAIKENIREYIMVEAGVRVTVDAEITEPERLIISTPCRAESSYILSNITELIFNSLVGYYFSANPRTNHFGGSNTALEGFSNAVLRRELEKICLQASTRPDIASRFITNVQFEKDKLVHSKNNLFESLLKECLDIHLGYRIVLYGPQMNNFSFFVPVKEGEMIISQIYHNLELLLHQNFVAYDDLADQSYLRVSNTLILKELISMMKKARNKETLRKKIINNVKFATTITDDPVKLYGEAAGDIVYDTINQVDNAAVREASDRSKYLYNTFVVKSANNAEDTVDYKNMLGFDETVIQDRADYSEEYEVEGQPVQKTVQVETAEVSEEVEEAEEAEETNELSLSLDDDNSLEEL